MLGTFQTASRGRLCTSSLDSTPEDFVGEEPNFAGNPERRKLAIAGYLALCTFIDEKIGLILDALEQTGLVDNISLSIAPTMETTSALEACGVNPMSTVSPRPCP